LPNFIETYHCRTGTVNPISYPVSSVDELTKCLEQATEAHNSGALLDTRVRTNFLNELHEQIIARKEDLFDLYETETSLSRSRFETEFERTLNQLRLYRDAASALEEQDTESVLVDRIITKKPLPIGPIAVFGASNFPLAYSTLGGDVMGAFAAGCPVIVKGHPFHAGTSLLSSEIIQGTLRKLNLHPGIFGHVLDDGYTIGQALVQDERIKGCGFTGSFNGGMALYRIAQNRKEPIPFFAEMGSLNPVIILPDAENLSSHLNTLVDSIVADAGQFCTKPGVIFCPSSLIGEAIQLMKMRFNQALNHPMLHPTIQTRYQKRLNEIQTSSIGSFYVTHGNELAATQGFLHVNHIEFNTHKSLTQEVFGPFCILAEYTDMDPIEKTLSMLQGQLTTTIIGRNPQESTLYSVACSLSGRIILNGVPTGVSVVPHMHHGGPYPASSDSRFTAVGEASILRFVRYVSVQKLH
jgi:NADP-dependent aldehyde dehydrogenase